MARTRSKRSRARKRAILLYAAGESDANALYASGFRCPDPFVFIRTASGRRVMAMSDLEIDRARSQSNAHRLLRYADFSRKAQERLGHAPHPGDVIAEVLRALRIRGVTVPENFPTGVADRLRTHGVGVRTAPDPFFRGRLHKTPEEVRHVTRTMRATERGLDAAVEVLRASTIDKGWVVHGGRRLTAQTLRGVIDETIFAQGCIPSGTIVAPGKHGCDPHDVGSGPIRAHQPLIIDVFPRSERSGYFGDITRTFVKGRAGERVRRMYDAVLAGQRMGLRMIRPGVKARDIHQAILDLFEERGFSTGRIDGRMQGFFHGTGHGLGLEIHEPPRIALTDNVLEKTMVVTVEPGLYYHPVGGVRIEDTVLVTERGIRNLTRFPKFLEIP